MSNKKPTTADLHDRLIDTALREVVGSETPPDLSEKILAAAGGKSPPLATLGDDAMTKKHQQSRRKRNFYIGAVLAASLLVAAGLIFPKGLEQASQNVAKSKSLAPAVKTDTSQDAKLENAAGTTVELPEFEMVPVETTVTVTDGGTVLLSGNKPDVEAWRRIIDQNKKEKLMMAVTPHIIIQEEEEERLGITDEKQKRLKVKVHPVEDLVLPVPTAPMGLEGLIGDAYAARSPPKSTFLATMGRQKKFDLGDVWNAPPKSSRWGYTGQSPTTAGEALGRHGKKTDTALPHTGKADPVLVARRSEVSRLLRDKVEKYHTLTAELGGTESPVHHAVLNMLINETRQIQSEIIKAKENSQGDENSQKLIAILEEEYETKVAEIERKGDRSGQLSLLEAEIEHLQKLEQGQVLDASGDQYTRIYENPFIAAEGEQAVSTFSIDVDTASYANVRQFLMQSGQLPPPDAVRIEELINYFSYDYTPPTDDTPFAAHVEIAGCPWHAEHRLVRVGIKGHEIANEKRPQSNLVFLIDVSGSMNQQNKLPLLVEGLKMLTRQLGENDRVAIVVYASSEGLALPSTCGDEQTVILAALEKLRAGGSTAGGAGIQLAYKIARANFIEGGVNRVILATDGDFNVGTTSTGELERLAESNAQETGVFLTVLGFGRGNLNDAMMEAISGKGNGNYHYVDNRAEARKVLVEEIAGTLVTIAKDVKIQIEFNPAQVAAYRLIGYENRMLETQDFNDDKKDAGEIGAGHTVTAIYEVVPAGQTVDTPAVDALKYQQHADKAKTASVADASDELLTLKLRYKQPDGDKSTKLEFPIVDNGQLFAEATDDFKFASAVTSFGMLLRHSEHCGTASYDAVLEIAEDGSGKDLRGYRLEFLQLVRQAKALAGE